MKIIILSIFLVFLLSSLSIAADLGISPPEMEFYAKTGEKVCKTLTLTSSKELTLTASDKWSKKGHLNRELSFHNLDSSSLGIKIEYTEKITLNQKQQVEICITPTKKGIYHGAMLFKAENSNVAAGNWIILSATGEDLEEETENLDSSVTGRAVNLNEFGSKSLIPILLFILTLFNFSLLIYLYRKTKKKKRKSRK